MKKALVGSLVLSVIGIAAGAQTLDAAKVPVPVKNAFAIQYPGLHPKWENENGKFEAGFKKDGKTMSAFYAADGTLNETETNIKVAGLPAAVRSYVKEHYKGAPIKEAAKIDKADGTVNYEAEVNKIDVLFDASGKFLKEVKD